MPGRRPLAWAAATLALVAGGCTGTPQGGGDPGDPGGSGGGSGDGSGDGSGPDAAVAVQPPAVGDCRLLAPDQLAAPSNDSPVVACEEPHSSETFHVGELTGRAARAGRDDPALGAVAYDRCRPRWKRFIGADESLALRTLLSWAWFRPTEEQWEAGARWFRCDVVGGTAGSGGSAALPALPRTTEGVLLGRPDDQWLACIDARTVDGSPWLPCTRPHRWRAVTTIVVGERRDPYPGDRVVEVVSRDYCRASVLAWLDYPLEFEFGYTWFHRQEWERGNRRSVCWARTDR